MVSDRQVGASAGQVAASDGKTSIPDDVAAVVRRYRRTERLLTGALLVVVLGAVGAALVALPVVPALVVALAAAVAVRAPLFRTGGTAQLRTDASPETVRADFAGATPPVLAFQWGVADSVDATADGGRYELSALFGLWSVTMETATGRGGEGATADRDGVAPLELRVTAGGQPWGAYDVVTREHDGVTVVDVTVTSERRFGLRRLPQWVAAEHHRADALAAQGYTVVERDVRPRFRG